MPDTVIVCPSRCVPAVRRRARPLLALAPRQVTAGWVVFHQGRPVAAAETRPEAAEAARAAGFSRGVARPVRANELDALGLPLVSRRGRLDPSPVPPRKRRGLLSWASLWLWRAPYEPGAGARRGNAVATRARLAPGNGRTDL